MLFRAQNKGNEISIYIFYNWMNNIKDVTSKLQGKFLKSSVFCIQKAFKDHTLINRLHIVSTI